MSDIATAILAIKSDAQVSVNAEDINQITWHDDNPTNITNEDIFNEISMKISETSIKMGDKLS